MKDLDVIEQRWKELPPRVRYRYRTRHVQAERRPYVKSLVWLAATQDDAAAKRELARLFVGGVPVESISCRGTAERPAPRGLGNVLDVFCFGEAGAARMKDE